MVPLASYVVASQGICPVSQRPLRCVEDGQRFSLVVLFRSWLRPALRTYGVRACEIARRHFLLNMQPNACDYPPDPLFYVPALC